MFCQHLPFKSKDYSLDLGLISFDAKKEVYFLIVNHNPVDIDLKSIKSSIPMTSAEVYGCGNNDYKLALFQVSFKNLTKCVRFERGAKNISCFHVRFLNLDPFEAKQLRVNKTACANFQCGGPDMGRCSN